MEDSRWRICPICGKGFMMAPEHGLTDYDGHPVCTPHCNHIAYERKYGGKKKKRGENTYEHMRERQSRYQRERRAGEKTSRKPRFTKPVNVIKKSDGSIMATHPSVRAAAEATGFSAVSVSQFCNGMRNTRGDYTFEFAEKQQDTNGRAIWEFVPQSKSVVRLDLNGNLIARHDSQKAAALASGCSTASVSLVCNHRQYQANGFIFMFESEYERGKKKNDV